MKALLLLFILPGLSFANVAFKAPQESLSFCQNQSGILNIDEATPVQAGGRVKPYYVLAKESMNFIWGKYKMDRQLAFCQIAFSKKFEGELIVPVLVEHVDSKKFLGLKEKDLYISSAELIAKKDLLRSEIVQQKENNSYKKDLNKIFTRLSTLEAIINGRALSIYAENNAQFSWVASSAFFDKESSSLLAIIKQSKKNYENKVGDTHILELKFAKSHIFSYALLVALISIFVLVLTKGLKVGVSLAIVTVLIQIVGMTMRVLISGRAPITNMYETVMFSGVGSLILALIILIFKKDKSFILAGLGYNILCLFMMMFANNMLSSSISPLVPVLRDNFWLSTHVTTIILSYAALALTWILANITLLKLRFKKISKKEYRHAQELIYTCMKVGVVLLAAGIILGGVWADYSWGRFWGWDPKETWSLIVLLFYMAIMHGKYTKWVSTHRFVMLAAAGFMTVMMAWFGVNYILASGLHSYGFSEGGAIFLGSFFLVQIAILIICQIKTEFKDEQTA